MKCFYYIGVMAVVVLTLMTVSTATAAIVSFQALLNGANENPPNASPGTGFTQVDFDIVAHTMRVQVSFSDLVGTTTAAHIHAAVAAPGNVGVATQTPSFIGFPFGVTSGVYDNTFDMTLASSYNATYIAANGGTPASAEAALFAAMSAEMSYLNIHSTFSPGGEIRGFLEPTAGPEPSTLALAGLGLAGLGMVGRRRRRV